MPQHLTQAQLDYFTEQTRLAVNKSLRKYVRGAIVGFLVLAFGFGYALHENSVTSNEGREAVVNSGKAVSVAGCNRDFRATERARGLLIRAQDATTRQHEAGKIPDDQFKEAQDFYAKELSKNPLPDCRKVEVALTDDPNAPISIPPALYPKTN